VSVVLQARASAVKFPGGEGKGGATKKTWPKNSTINTSISIMYENRGRGRGPWPVAPPSANAHDHTSSCTHVIMHRTVLFELQYVFCQASASVVKRKRAATFRVHLLTRLSTNCATSSLHLHYLSTRSTLSKDTRSALAGLFSTLFLYSFFLIRTSKF